MDVEAQVKAVIMEVELNAPEGVRFPTDWLVKFYRKSPVAGKAKGPRTILINSDLAEQYPEQLRDTVIHEMAHCLVYRNVPHRCKPHGPEWQDMMYLLGIEPETCHRMEQPNLKRVKHRTHRYHCGCGDHQIKTGRHNDIIMGLKTFTCRKCGGKLVYQGV